MGMSLESGLFGFPGLVGVAEPLGALLGADDFCLGVAIGAADADGSGTDRVSWARAPAKASAQAIPNKISAGTANGL